MAVTSRQEIINCVKRCDPRTSKLVSLSPGGFFKDLLLQQLNIQHLNTLLVLLCDVFNAGVIYCIFKLHNTNKL